MTPTHTRRVEVPNRMPQTSYEDMFCQENRYWSASLQQFLLFKLETSSHIDLNLMLQSTGKKNIFFLCHWELHLDPP